MSLSTNFVKVGLLSLGFTSCTSSPSFQPQASDKSLSPETQDYFTQIDHPVPHILPSQLSQTETFRIAYPYSPYLDEQEHLLRPMYPYDSSEWASHALTTSANQTATTTATLDPLNLTVFGLSILTLTGLLISSLRQPEPSETEKKEREVSLHTRLLKLKINEVYTGAKKLYEIAEVETDFASMTPYKENRNLLQRIVALKAFSKIADIIEQHNLNQDDANLEEMLGVCKEYAKLLSGLEAKAQSKHGNFGTLLQSVTQALLYCTDWKKDQTLALLQEFAKLQKRSSNLQKAKASEEA